MIFFISKQIHKNRQIVKFIISGGTAAFINLSLLFILTEFFGLWYLFSAILSFLVSFLVSFFMQKFWTFRDKNKNQIHKQIFLYLISALAGLVLNAFLMYLFVDGLKLWYMLAQIITGIIIAVGNFFVYKFIIFRKKEIAVIEKKKGINVLIATGIYPPDIGGPATYAFFLKKELLKLGCKITIITFGEKDGFDFNENIFYVSRTGNIFTRYMKFFWRIYQQADWADIIYTLDLMSVGLPAVLVASLKRKKIVFRTGGDFLWEKAYQSGWTRLSLSRYYEDKKKWHEKLLMSFCRWILRRIDLVIFSTKFQAKIYGLHYGVAPHKSVILSNALPAVKVDKIEEQFKSSIVFAGRLIEIKNLKRLIKVFGKINSMRNKLLIFGDGPEKEKLQELIKELKAQDKIKLMNVVEHRELMSIIAGCRFFILPSLSEISPNLALECIGLAKPIILTKETGLDEEITRNLITINPLSEEDIEAKINYLLDDNNLNAYEAKLRQFNITWREWSQVAIEHLNLFKKLLNF